MLRRLQPEFRAATRLHSHLMDSGCEVAAEGLVQEEASPGGNLNLEGTENHPSEGVGVIVNLEDLLGSDDGAAGVRHVGM